MNVLLIAGILLRFFVFFTSLGVNADRHLDVIQYIADQRALPVSNQLSQSYHPPLYYVLMAPVRAWWPAVGPVHFASFVISSLNLFLIRRLIAHPLVIRHASAATIAFAFICFLPQVVMFGDFISNDTLAMLIGTLQFAAALAWLRRPTRGRLIALAALAGIGLLTKGTFLLTPIALTAFVVWIETRRRGARIGAVTTLVFTLIWSIIGCYKFVENTVHFGRPIVHNLDAVEQHGGVPRGAWRGWQTAVDVDVTKLIGRPILDVNDTFSIPLLLYGTFWYPHIPDSSFRGNVSGYQWVGSALYACAVVPTVVFLVGLAQALVTTWRATLMRSHRPRAAIITLSVALLASNLAVVIAAGLRYDVWWCFQSRLCFQSLLPVIVLFGLGMETVARHRCSRRIAYISCVATIACCLLYFVVELALVGGMLPAGALDNPPKQLTP